MKARIFIPTSLRNAGKNLRVGLQTAPASLAKADFVGVWSVGFESHGGKRDYRFCHSKSSRMTSRNLEGLPEYINAA